MIFPLTSRLLTNEKRGEFYGVSETWTARQRKQLGAYLVYRAMQVFLAEGERRLGPLDLWRRKEERKVSYAFIYSETITTRPITETIGRCYKNVNKNQ